MKKILVAVDGSESAKKAAQKAADFAEDLDSKVTMIHVYTERAQIPVNQFNEVSSYLSAETLEEIMQEQEKQLELREKKLLIKMLNFLKKKGWKLKNY